MRHALSRVLERGWSPVVCLAVGDIAGEVVSSDQCGKGMGTPAWAGAQAGGGEVAQGGQSVAPRPARAFALVSIEAK